MNKLLQLALVLLCFQAFSQEQKLDSMTQENYIPFTENKYPVNSAHYTYDNSIQPTKYLEKFYSEDTGELIDSSIIEVEFDENLNETSQVSFYYFPDPSERIENTYDSDNRVISSVRYNFSNNEFVKSYKEEFTYDDQGRVSVTLAYRWNSDTSTWGFVAKQENNDYHGENSGEIHVNVVSPLVTFLHMCVLKITQI